MIRFALKSRIKEIFEKTSILLQCTFAGIPFPDDANHLSNEARLTLTNADRVSRGMLEIFLIKRELVSLNNCINM